MRLVDADKIAKKLVKLIECEGTVYPRRGAWIGEAQLHRTFVAKCSKCGKLAAIDSYCGPVLIVHGDSDETVPYAYAAEAQKQYADCTLIPIAGAGHCFDDHLDEMFDSVVSFLARIQGCKRPQG